MSDKEKIVTNSDNDWLEPMYEFLDEVDGPGAEEIRVFISTRNELIQLVKYWAKVKIDLNYFMFLYQQTGSDWRRETSFAEFRIGHIAKIIGNDEVDKAVEEAYAEFGERQDKRYWDIYLNGTEEQQDEIKNEVQQEIAKQIGKKPA